MKSLIVLLVAALSCAPVGAHHSYAQFDLDKPFVFTGTLREVEWTNPHIQLVIDNGTDTMRVEWITVFGADRSGLKREQFNVGERLTVTGSRHRDPEVALMSMLTDVKMLDHDLHWVVPTGIGAAPPGLVEN